MFAQARLNELHARKQLLVTQADLQRRLLRLEAENVAAAIRWLDPVYRLWQNVKPFAWAAAPVLGFFLARGRSSVLRWGLRGLGLWHWFRRFVRE